MHKVTNFSVYSHCNDLGGKVWNPAIKWTKKYAVFVQLETETGFTGLGECWCFDTSPEVLVSFLRTEIAPLVVGASLDSLETIFKHLFIRATLTARHGILASALSGVDISAWDIRSQSAGLPLWAYIQGFISKSSSDSVFKGSQVKAGNMQLYGSGGLYGQNKSVADLCLEMSNMAQIGFDTVKMKVGGLSMPEDLERVHSVLSAIGDSHSLIIDGVYSYTPSQALELFRALPSERIAAFQSPVNASDLEGMRMLCESSVPVMGTEAEYREELHSLLIGNKCVRYLQTAPIACGGITRLVELHKQIQRSHNESIALSLEVSSTAIALVIACHIAAASDLVAHAEYHFVHQVFFEQLPLENVASVPGQYRLSDNPGLGVQLPLDQVKHEISISA